MTGRPIEGQLHPSLEMFHLCENLKWTHLPVAGGIHDQHPRFIKDIMYIFAEKNAAEAQQAEEMKRKQKSMSRSSSRW